MYTRREALWLGAGALAAIGGLLRCKRSEDPAKIACDSGALTADEQRVRAAVGYVERSKQVGKNCTACQQYLPASRPDSCGTCRILKGPTHPLGYCNAYTPKA